MTVLSKCLSATLDALQKYGLRKKVNGCGFTSMNLHWLPNSNFILNGRLKKMKKLTFLYFFAMVQSLFLQKIVSVNQIAQLTAAAYSLNTRSIVDGQVVKRKNNLKDDVTLLAGDNIAISENGSNLRITLRGCDGYRRNERQQWAE